MTRWPCVPGLRCPWCARAGLSYGHMHRRAWEWIAARRHAQWGYIPDPRPGTPSRGQRMTVPNGHLYTREAAAEAVRTELESLTPNRRTP